MAKQYDYLYKLLLIGDSGVGKTSLLLRFAEDQFSPTFITTIGIDFKIKMLDIDGKRVKLQVWDTAGQERFRTITTAYYRGAMGIILVFDVTDQRSFDSINNWLRNIEEHANTDVEVLLVGNKTDMADKRAVSNALAQQLAAQSNVKYLEASAKSGLGVERIFQTITRDILLKNERRSATQHPNNGQRPASAGEGPVKLTKRKKTGSSGWGKCAIL